MGSFKKLVEATSRVTESKERLQVKMGWLNRDFEEVNDRFEEIMGFLRGCFGDIESKEKHLRTVEDSVKQRCEEFNSKRSLIEKGLKGLDEREEFLKGAFQKMEMEEMKCGKMRIFIDDQLKDVCLKQQQLEGELEKRGNELDLIQENLRRREGEIDAKEKILDLREENVNATERILETEKNEIELERKRLEMEEMKCGKMRRFIDDQLNDVLLKQQQLDGHFELEKKRRNELDWNEENLRRREGEIDAKEKNLDMREEKVNAIEQLLKTKKNEIESEMKRLEKRSKELDSRGRHLMELKEELDNKKNDEAGRETETVSEQKMLLERDSQVYSKERLSEKMTGRKRLCHADEEIKFQGSSSKHRSCNSDKCIGKNEAHSLQNSDSIGSFASNIIGDPGFPAVEKGKRARFFRVGETWACFDEKYNMPRSYAQIMNIINEDGQVKLEVTWLKPCSIKKAEKHWIDAGLTATCGRFEPNRTSVESPIIFSHPTSRVRKDPCVIIPLQGEIWAIYKDWDIIEWVSDAEMYRNCEYEIVEIMPYLPYGSSSLGFRVAYLDRITASAHSFKRRSKNNADSFLIDPDSIYRFSHKVPSIKKTYNDENGIVDCVFKLDQKCLPPVMETCRTVEVEAARESNCRNYNRQISLLN